MSNPRQTPEQLLRRVHEEERKERRGKLKIYLGAAPGVGKTHQMLQDALEKRANGLDVVVGVAESHGRKEIDVMLKALDVLARQVVHYHQNTLLELDLDAVLKRYPGLVLIDEMAHTNAPGLRHAKRWQDIKEILDRGIDVYTTLNVQHIESLNDDVTGIIQVPIKETVPDSMIELADTLELIDLPPDDLLKRLHEGKVYIPRQAEIAVEHFFRKGNLIALRELALRITAEHVSAEVLTYRQGEGIKRIWSTNEKILVCVSNDPNSIKLIRTAKRIAAQLQAEWLAVYVEKPSLQPSEIKRNESIKNLHLAELLGAQTYVLTGFDVVKEIINFAHEQNITLIMIWKNIHSRWLSWISRNLADEIIRQSGEIDVYVMTPESGVLRKTVKKIKTHLPTPWNSYVFAVAIVGLATIINGLLSPMLTIEVTVMVYFLAIMTVSLFGHIGPSILASMLSIAAYHFFFVIHFSRWSTLNFESVFTMGLMFFVTQLMSQLIILTRREAQSARFTQQQTSALFALSRQLISIWGQDKLLDAGIRYIANAFASDVLVLLPKSGHLEIRAYSNLKDLSTKELSIAEWVYESGKMAGLGTETLAFSNALYLPLVASRGPIGVIRICPEKRQLFSPDQLRLLELCVNQLTLSLEVDRLQTKATQKEWKRKSERERHSLLQSISNNLRTPLSTVIDATHDLLIVEKKQMGVIEKDVQLEMDQLIRLNNNILQIIQLETQATQLGKQYSINHLIAQVVSEKRDRLKNRNVSIDAHDDLPQITMDHVLLEEVLNHLLENAAQYTPDDTPIAISAKIAKDRLLVSIEDSGPGIILDEMQQLFEKLYRSELSDADHGLGLGLAICQKIITLHGGEIWAENRPKGGATFYFTLPLRDE
jgi:two-component system sensor histidine kinase KdpD